MACVPLFYLEFVAMSNALELIAFARTNRMQGTLALLDATQRAMDVDGHALPAAILEMARETYIGKQVEAFGPHALVHHG